LFLNFFEIWDDFSNFWGKFFLSMGNFFLLLGNFFIFLGKFFLFLGKFFHFLGTIFLFLGTIFIFLGTIFIFLGEIFLGKFFLFLGKFLWFLGKFLMGKFFLFLGKFFLFLGTFLIYALFSTQFKIFNVIPEENVLMEVQTNFLKINSSFHSKLLCSAISEIEFPAWVVGKFYFDKQLFQILDINLPSLDFDHENKKILLKFERVRFARTNLSIRQTDLIENLLNEVLSEPLGFSFQILVKRLSIVYFSPNLNSEEWYLMVLNNFESNYSFKVENENKTEILTIEFVGIRKETRKCKHTFDHDKSGCFLIKNSLNANNLFTQNDNRKWLDLVTSASFKNKSQAIVIFTDCCFKFSFFTALKKEKINWNLDVKDSIEILLNKDLFKKFCLIFLRQEFRKSQNYENFNGHNLQRENIHLYDFNRNKLKLSNDFECFSQQDFAFLCFTHLLATCSKLQKFLTFINKNSLA
jgi:hypothetical protein